MEGAYLYAWNNTTSEWVKVSVTAAGYIEVAIS